MSNKSASALVTKLKRDRDEINHRIRIYSEQKLTHEVAYLRLKEEILNPIIWELEEVEEYEKKLKEKIPSNNPVKP